MRRLKSGRLVLDKKKIAEESRYDGKYVLLTTDRKLDACELACQYKHLFSVERAFRSLKSGMNLRPINHYKNERIKAHVSLCVLSYLLTQSIKSLSFIPQRIHRIGFGGLECLKTHR